jgi:hypothetical protein
MIKFIATPILFLAAVIVQAQTAKPVKIPMSTDRWLVPPNSAEFIQHKGVPAVKIVSDNAKLVLKDVDFSSGTIEFDVESVAPPFTGIYFRRQNDAESEYFYLRVERAGKPLMGDAVQYCPVIRSVTLWDMLGHYQGPANIKKADWNHIKMVVSGLQMLVYVNDMKRAALQIPRLEGNTTSGGIALTGKSIFANLVITPGETNGLSPVEGFDPVYHDSRYLRGWLVGKPFTLPFGKEVSQPDLPGSDYKWDTITAERRGLVNLTRVFGIDTVRRMVWMKMTLNAEKEQVRKMDIGFSDEVWVIVNGQLAYTDKNWYGSPIMKQPDGRCSIENSSFNLPLKSGANEILVGVVNSFYGWGFIGRLDKNDGLSY